MVTVTMPPATAIQPVGLTSPPVATSTSSTSLVSAAPSIACSHSQRSCAASCSDVQTSVVSLLQVGVGSAVMVPPPSAACGLDRIRSRMSMAIVVAVVR